LAYKKKIQPEGKVKQPHQVGREKASRGVRFYQGFAGPRRRARPQIESQGTKNPTTNNQKKKHPSFRPVPNLSVWRSPRRGELRKEKGLLGEIGKKKKDILSKQGGGETPKATAQTQNPPNPPQGSTRKK